MPLSEKSRVNNTALHSLLQAEQGGGTLESAGVWTLSNRQALEKLAAYSLPRPHAWILLIVQAAVAARCDLLQIALGPSSVRIRFKPGHPWSSADFQHELLDARRSAEPGLDALKRALWHIGFHRKQPFHLRLPDAQHALVWDGQQLHQQPRSGPSDWAQLIVSHHNTGARKPTKVRHVNALLRDELLHYAHAAPIPIQVDGRRLDRLQNAPEYGSARRRLPLGLLLFDADVPAQPVPPATLPAEPTAAATLPAQPTAAATLPAQPVDPASLPIWSSSDRPTVCALASLAVQQARFPEGSWNLEPDVHHSRIYWVQHGVIVCEEQVATPPRALALAIYASAEGLETDLSGLHLLLLQPEHRRRRQAIGRAVQANLPSVPSGLTDAYARSAHKSSRNLTVVGGSLVSVVGYFTWLALGATPAGLLGASLGSWAPLAASVVGASWFRRRHIDAEVARQVAFERNYRAERDLFENDWRRAQPNLW